MRRGWEEISTENGDEEENEKKKGKKKRLFFLCCLAAAAWLLTSPTSPPLPSPFKFFSLLLITSSKRFSLPFFFLSKIVSAHIVLCVQVVFFSFCIYC